MSEVPASIKAPPAPQVNLLPPEVEQRRKRGRQRGVVLTFFALFLLAVAAGYVLVAWQAAAAQLAFAEEEARTETLNAELASYSEVDVVKERLANADAARKYAASIELFYPLVVSSVVGALPPTAQLDTLTFSMPAANTSPAVPVSPLGIPGVGELLLSVIVPEPVDGPAIQERLDTMPLFARARVTTTEIQATENSGESAPIDSSLPPTYRVDIRVVLTYDALMMRYSDAWFGREVADDGSVTINENNLKNYYEELYEALLAGDGMPEEFPPLPEVSPPPFVPGVDGLAPEPQPTPSPSPVEEEVG